MHMVELKCLLVSGPHASTKRLFLSLWEAPRRANSDSRKLHNIDQIADNSELQNQSGLLTPQSAAGLAPISRRVSQVGRPLVTARHISCFSVEASLAVAAHHSNYTSCK